MVLFPERTAVTKGIFFCGIVLAYLLVMAPFTAYLKGRPVAVKLGYTPEAEVIKAVTGDQRYLVADYTVLKVLFYYGSLVEKWQNKVKLPAENYNMFKTLETAVKLDPYNMDAYYFTEAAFTWELGRAQDVNRMLIYGTKYRTWDYNLPFYIGFNYAYFLKDYADAANYMKRAAEISKEPLYTTLAARFFYDSGRTDLGIIFLSAMERGVRDQKIKSLYGARKAALLAVRTLERSVASFRASHGREPADLNELVTSGSLRAIPLDPYGGTFYLGPGGKVASTSKFAFGGKQK